MFDLFHEYKGREQAKISAIVHASVLVAGGSLVYGGSAIPVASAALVIMALVSSFAGYFYWYATDHVWYFHSECMAVCKMLCDKSKDAPLDEGEMANWRKADSDKNRCEAVGQRMQRNTFAGVASSYLFSVLALTNARVMAFIPGTKESLLLVVLGYAILIFSSCFWDFTRILKQEDESESKN